MGVQKKQVIHFLLKTLLFVIPVLLLHVLAVYMANETTDEQYAKFTGSRKSSLIIGTSRASQCVLPSVINAAFAEKKIVANIYNYAFNLAVSPYGKAYYEAIKNKIDTQVHSKNNFFIICVDPWSISKEKSAPDTDDGQSEYKKENPLTFLKSYAANPNWDYLLYKFNEGWGQILVRRYFKSGYATLHKDGWLELSPAMDSVTVKKRTANRTNIYINEMPQKYTYSANRLQWLKQTIKLCGNYGKVFLVRLPMSQTIYKVEQSYMPKFDGTMQALSNELNSVYLNYAAKGDSYLYADGNHMYKTSGAVFSSLLSKDLLPFFTAD